jgi:hypothetical protein
MDFISRDALIAVRERLVDKDRPLGEVLQEQGVLSPQRRALLDALVAEQMQGRGAGGGQDPADVPSTGDGTPRATAGGGIPPDQPAGGATLATSAEQPADNGSRYRVLRPHAQGGLGVVSVARDTELGREVAFKEIQARYAANTNLRGRFVREAEITGALEHPGVVPVYGLGRHSDGRPYYAMRFVRGETLQEAAQKLHSGNASYTLRGLLARFVAVCNAVAYAHSRGVIHRDLKPANVMLGPFGETLVVDWGLAKVVGRDGEMSRCADAEATLQPSSGEGSETQPGSALGTPAFMSPEQARGELDALGPASDVYSLGTTLYVLLTGRPPVPPQDAARVLEAVRKGDWVAPRVANPTVSLALDAICRRAMSPLPADRYATALELAADVERWLADVPVSACSERWPARAGRWARRHPRLVSGGTALVGTLAIAFAVGLALVEREGQRTRDANAALAQSNTKLEATNATLTTANTSLAESNAALKAEKRRAFITALNKRMSTGVTPDNNAHVLIWKALGPNAADEGAMPPEYFQWLGIEAPPERGDYFVTFEKYTQVHLKDDPKAALEHLERARARPWTVDRFPEVASWLNANAGPLAVAVEATKRPQYYSPAVPARTATLLSASFPTTQASRRLAGALIARAMQRVGQGSVDDAWRDLLACHRLGRLLGRGGTLVEFLVCISIDEMAGKAELAFLDRATLDAPRIESCLNDLLRLPPLPDAAERMSVGERFIALEAVTMPDGDKIDLVKRLYREAQSNDAPRHVSVERFLDSVSQEDVDWDTVLQTVSRWYDRAAEAMRIPDRGMRAKELRQIESQLKASLDDCESRHAGANHGIRDRLVNGKIVGEILLSLVAPAPLTVQNVSDRARQTEENLDLAFALAWCRRERGHYPQSLDELAPKYITRVALDRFSGRALVYRPTEDNYQLYSVGVNGVDEQGRGPDDKPPGDDLSVRMPLPELPAQK